NIKVDKKSGDRGQYLSDIIIHKSKPQVAGNHTVIKAREGEILNRKNSNTLSLVLMDGNYYDDVHQRDTRKRNRRHFTKSSFEKYTINIDLTEFNNIDLMEEQDLANEKMYRINELRYEIDSMSKHFSSDLKNFPQTSYIRSGISTLNAGYKTESVEKKYDHFMDAFTPGQKKQLYESALSNLYNTNESIKAKAKDYENQLKRLNKYEIALHEKYAMAAACIILFFVGAPLGAIIRKGGMGLPMVIAIVLFL